MLRRAVILEQIVAFLIQHRNELSRSIEQRISGLKVSQLAVEFVSSAR